MSPAVTAETLDAGELLERVQLWLDGTRDLRGRFEQTLVSGALGSGLRETGEVYIERPGRVRFDYLDPERKVALVREEKTWFYMEEDEQLLRGRIDESGDLLPRLLAGSARLDDLFETALGEVTELEGGMAYRLELVPRGEAESFEQVVLTLSADDFSIREAEVLDAAGNQMLYRFLDLRRNEGLEPGLFWFEPPPGTVITGEH
jgi:outer membrane lipoprotein carrier protein